MKIIVTDGEQRSALAAARSLTAAGHRVMVGAVRRPSLAGRSRAAEETFTYADPAESPGAFVHDISAEAERFGAELVMPMTDASVFALAERAERAEGNSPSFNRPPRFSRAPRINSRWSVLPGRSTFRFRGRRNGAAASTPFRRSPILWS
ncbi:MAG: hypothetical protein M5R36_12250 [Deltaproteobacteria bacterium]|nr:hypothetical protein [Deltaproteobacteria bacterium]